MTMSWKDGAPAYSAPCLPALLRLLLARRSR